MGSGFGHIRKQIKSARIIYRVHAVRQMFARSVSETDVAGAVASGKIIEEYPDDLPPKLPGTGEKC